MGFHQYFFLLPFFFSILSRDSCHFSFYFKFEPLFYYYFFTLDFFKLFFFKFYLLILDWLEIELYVFFYGAILVLMTWVAFFKC